MCKGYAACCKQHVHPGASATRACGVGGAGQHAPAPALALHAVLCCTPIPLLPIRAQAPRDPAVWGPWPILPTSQPPSLPTSQHPSAHAARTRVPARRGHPVGGHRACVAVVVARARQVLLIAVAAKDEQLVIPRRNLACIHIRSWGARESAVRPLAEGQGERPTCLPQTSSWWSLVRRPAPQAAEADRVCLARDAYGALLHTVPRHYLSGRLGRALWPSGCPVRSQLPPSRLNPSPLPNLACSGLRT